MFLGLGCGCLLAMGIGLAPRLFLILAWIFSDRWARVWDGNWILPLIGIILVPYTTVMYMLVWTANGIAGWDWLWILLGLMLDVMKWGQIYNERKGVPGYPSDSSSSTPPTTSSPPPAAQASAATPAAATSTAAAAPPPAAAEPTPETPAEPSADGGGEQPAGSSSNGSSEEPPKPA